MIEIKTKLKKRNGISPKRYFFLLLLLMLLCAFVLIIIRRKRRRSCKINGPNRVGVESRAEAFSNLRYEEKLMKLCS